MKQLSFFESSESVPRDAASDRKPDYWKLFVDGAARNNPGPAGAGICIVKNEVVHAKKGFYLGSKTNNQAEYLALIMGIFLVKNMMQPDDLLLIVSDSQLLVRQFYGTYKVKETHLKLLHALAKSLVVDMHYAIFHIFREENGDADEQANYAVDHKVPLTPELINLLKKHDIHL